MILAVSADARRGGAAVLIEGRLAALPTRLFLKDASCRVDRQVVRTWVLEFIELYEPQIVVVVNEAPRSGASALLEILQRTVADWSRSSGVACLDISFAEIQRGLALAERSHAELRRLLVASYGPVRRRLRFLRGRRSESERYRNSSLLALGAAETVFRGSAHPPNSSDPPAGLRPPDGCFIAPIL